jgi:putative NADH-flavin reductase
MTMKLIVFGASGGTGQEVVKQALEQGHQVTAFVRNPTKMTLKSPNLLVFEGNIMDLGSVKKAIQGQDGVVCNIGSGVFKIGTIRSDAAQNIVAAMEQTGVKRLVLQTSLGCGDSKVSFDKMPFVFRKVLVPFFMQKALDDHELQEDCLKNSTLDWVVVRPAGLNNGKLTGNYRHGFAYNDTSITLQISRADTADFMLKQVASDLYLKQKVGLSY